MSVNEGSDTPTPNPSVSFVLPIQREANETTNLRPAIKAQVGSQDEVQRLFEAPKIPKAVHFDGAPEYIEDNFNGTPPSGICPSWVGIRSTIYYSMSDSAENLSDLLQPDTVVRRTPRRRRSGLPIEYRNDSKTGSSSGLDDISSASPLSQRSTGRTSL